ncbi:MAG: glycosyltransferase family 92 protein [Chlamydiota bacterium]
MFRVFFAVLALLGGIASNLSAYELAIGSMFRNEAPYLKEWVEYHFAAGVEHFWLYNDNSTDNWQEVLQPYIESGIVEVTYWPTPPGSYYTPTQVEAFKDAIKQAQGNTTWVALIDIDEFLVPMQGRSIPRCLNKYFSNASAIYVNWRNFGTGGVYIPQGEPILFRLTASSLSTHSDNAIGKSIVRPEAVDLASVWYPHHFILKQDANYYNGDRQKMFFRGMDLPTDGVHYDRFIRINHYVLRDEGFYQNVRLAKANQGSSDKNLLLEHYDSFSAVQDYSIIKFIQNNFQPKYKKIWKD